MTIDPENAALSLTDVSRIERRTREALRYGGASAFLFLWGALTTFGYLFGYFDPKDAHAAWTIILPLGAASSFAIGYWRRRARGGQADQKMLFAQLVLMGFGTLWSQLFGSFDFRGLDAFWPTLFMMGFILSGLWVGRFFIVVGLIVTALTIVGFLWSGPWLGLWMAVVNGGGLIAGGIWLRRIGVSR